MEGTRDHRLTALASQQSPNTAKALFQIGQTSRESGCYASGLTVADEIRAATFIQLEPVDALLDEQLIVMRRENLPRLGQGEIRRDAAESLVRPGVRKDRLVK